LSAPREALIIGMKKLPVLIHTGSQNLFQRGYYIGLTLTSVKAGVKCIEILGIQLILRDAQTFPETGGLK